MKKTSMLKLVQRDFQASRQKTLPSIWLIGHRRTNRRPTSISRYFGDLVSKSYRWPRAGQCLFIQKSVLSSSVQMKATLPYLPGNREKTWAVRRWLFSHLLKTLCYSEILCSRGWQTIAHGLYPAHCLPSVGRNMHTCSSDS